MRNGFKIAVLLALAAGSAQAAEHQVQMLNKGTAGTMVFEPAALKVAPGDTIRFVPTDKSHNVEAIKGMLPDGVKPFKGKMNEEYVLTVTAAGLYGIKCSPHYSMGMVALIQAGEAPSNLDTAKAVKLPALAGGRMKAAFAVLANQ